MIPQVVMIEYNIQEVGDLFVGDRVRTVSGWWHNNKDVGGHIGTIKELKIIREIKPTEIRGQVVYDVDFDEEITNEELENMWFWRQQLEKI